MESVNIDSEKKTQKVDRVVLDLESIVNVQSLQQQVNEQLGDLVQISLKDIVNFLLQERASSLSEEELNKLKSKHFNLVKALRKATSEVIKAKQNGSEIQLEEVLKIIQTPGVIQNTLLKKARGRKKKVLYEAVATNLTAPNEEPASPPTNDFKALSKNKKSDSKPLENQTISHLIST